MEDSTKTDATLRVFRRLRGQFENVGIVLQAYLYRTERDLNEVLALGARVRLCKGAYQEPASVLSLKRRTWTPTTSSSCGNCSRAASTTASPRTTKR